MANPAKFASQAFNLRSDLDQTPGSISATDVLQKIKGALLVPADGLFRRKSQRLLFTDLKSFEYGNYRKDVFSKREKSQLNYPDVEVFADPQQIRVSKKTIVSKVLTKGGWINQFWGHDLPRITITANSGYFGISKGRNPLAVGALGIYDRIKNAGGSGKNALQRGVDFIKKPQISANDDPLKVFEKLKQYAFDNRYDAELPYQGNPIITMVYEGTAYKGYFNSFDYRLDASKPFTINYTINFTVVSPPSKFLSLQRLKNSISAKGAVSAIGQGMDRGVAPLVGGGVRALSNAALSAGGALLASGVNRLAKKIGTKNAVDGTPSKIVLA